MKFIFYSSFEFFSSTASLYTDIKASNKEEGGMSGHMQGLINY